MPNKFLCYLFVFFLSFGSNLAFAQKVRLGIQVKAENNESVEFATIAIRNATKDSALVGSEVLNEQGNTSFFLKANATYNVQISKVGFNAFKKMFSLEKKDTTLQVLLTSNTTVLNELTVVGRQNLMRQEDDKTIVDAEPLSKLATNAFEVLEKVPGVIMVNDQFFLGKAEAATIFINGREMKLSGTDLASILKSMPPNAVAKIEVLRTPSAKFDASSSGGVINIVLKKGYDLGMSGNANVNYSQGVYAALGAGFSLNRGRGNANAYLNYQYNHRNNFESITSERVLGINAWLQQKSYATFPANTHYIAGGIDQKINAKWNIAYDAIINLDKNRSNAQNDNYFLPQPNVVPAVVNNNAITKNKFSIFSLNNTLNVTNKIDSLGSEWRNSANYILASSATQQNYQNNFFFPSNMPLVGIGSIDALRHFGSFASDYTKVFKNKSKIETGIKIDGQTNANEADFLLNQKIDVQRSIHYDFKENINAAYLQYSQPIAGFRLKTGLRLENTNMVGTQQTPTNASFTVHRTDFFPYFYLSRDLVKLFNKISLTGNLIARRTIARPSYQMLNPAVQYIDPYFTRSGNPALLPQFTNNYEFNVSFDDYPVFSAGISDSKNTFNKVTYQNVTTQIFNETYDNLGRLREYYLRFVVGMPPGGTYFFVAGANYQYQIYEGFYQKDALDFQRKTWTLFTYQELKFSKNTRMSMHGFMRIGGVQNFYDLENFGALSFNFIQNLPKQKLTLILNIRDVLYSLKFRFAINQSNIVANGERFGDSRRIGLTFRYDFGLKKEEKREGNRNFMEVNNH